MTSAGKLLRKAREEQNRSLAEIAEELCITQRYLRAVENDDLDNLPGIFFYKSFAKQYAKLLGLPLATIEPLMQAQASAVVEEKPAPAPPAATSQLESAMSAAASRLFPAQA